MELQKAVENAIDRMSGAGLDSFEAVVVSESRLTIEVKRQMVDLFCRSETRCVAVRVIKNGRLGYSATTDISAQALKQAVAEATATMENVAPSETAVLPSAEEPKGLLTEAQGRPFSEISDDDKVRMALLLENQAIAFNGKIIKVHHPKFEEFTRAVRVVNSKGVSVKAQRGMMLCELKAIASDGAAAEGAYDFGYSNRFEDLDAAAIARRAAGRAIEKLGARPMPSGNYPVVFSPRTASALVKLAASSFFADNVQKGRSRLAGKKGERIYNEKVSIIDDGLLPSGFNSFPFDGEGVPRRRNVLVMDGVIGGWLYDSASAVKDGVYSTGNSTREDLRKLPAIDVSNCYLKAGKEAPEELIRQMDKGLFVTELMGVHTANPISGDFSFGAEGFRIENGRRAGPVRGMTIAGNVHDVFARAACVANDLAFFGPTGAPTLAVEKMPLGG